MAKDESVDHHAEGEKDAAEYNGYNPPHDALETNFSSAAERYQKENEEYNAGWENARNQR